MIREDPLVLRRARWARSTSGQVLPVPATWDECPEVDRVLALVGCPKCGKANGLVESVHSVTSTGEVQPRFQCAECDFARGIYLDRWNKRKPLYAIAIERRAGNRIVAEMHYAHASNEREARFHLGPGNYRVVAVAPAVGYHAEDDNGEAASA